MTDKEKFQAWLAQCPVTVKKIEADYHNGWIDVTLQCRDEDEDKVETGE